jgi:hypothetical protein
MWFSVHLRGVFLWTRQCTLGLHTTFAKFLTTWITVVFARRTLVRRRLPLFKVLLIVWQVCFVFAVLYFVNFMSWRIICVLLSGWVRRGEEGSDCDVFWRNVAVFACRRWGELQEMLTRLAVFLHGIQNEDLKSVYKKILWHHYIVIQPSKIKTRIFLRVKTAGA